MWGTGFLKKKKSGCRLKGKCDCSELKGYLCLRGLKLFLYTLPSLLFLLQKLPKSVLFILEVMQPCAQSQFLTRLLLEQILNTV